jgi:hypothetical protein
MIADCHNQTKAAELIRRLGSFCECYGVLDSFMASYAIEIKAKANLAILSFDTPPAKITS